MAENILVDDLDETEVLLTLATSRHVRDLVVAGRAVVSDGQLAGVDLAETEAELMARARRAAADDPGQFARGARRREAVRAYYANRRRPA